VILMQYRPWGVRGDAWDDLCPNFEHAVWV
jgi:hypothetical protein